MRRFEFLLMSLILLFLPSLALSQQRDPQAGPGMMWGEGWYWMMFFGPLTMILFWGTIIFLIVLAIRWLSGAGHAGAAQITSAQQKSPLDILKERFARGEIDKDEYEERRRILDQ